jgi:hypothetical protein
MGRKWVFLLCGIGCWLLLSTAAFAGKWSAADFSLRVHIFGHSGVSHYHNQSLDGVDGEGRANLFENGQPRGFDFGYRCGERLRNSVGYETYMARWKKPGRTVQILLPVLGGKSGQMDSCDLEVTMKDGAYYTHNGQLSEEPQDKFKAWMEKHKYDPEHGLNEPVALEPAAATPPSPPAVPAPAQ